MKLQALHQIYSAKYNSNIQKPSKTGCLYKPLTLNADIVSFGASKKKPVKDLRSIPDITCACCGLATIKNSEIDSFLEKKIYYPAGDALNVIKASGVFNKKKLSQSQSEAYNFCKVLSVLCPDKTLSSILDIQSVNEKIQTFPKDVRDNIKEIETMTRRVCHNSQYMVQELQQFEPRMNKTEKEVFQLLKHYSTEYPNKSFSDIFNDPEIFTSHLKKLELEQGKVLFEIDNLAKKMSTPSRKKIHNLVKSAYKIFIEESSGIKNKRSRIIKMFEKAESKIPEKDLMREIENILYHLPSSRNNVSAFIVKYRYNNPNEIADLILRGSSSTYEHVKPHKRPNDPGEDDITNYLVLCKNCNQERQQIPYDEFIEYHKDMPQNAQKYLDKVIEYINNGLLSGHDHYPVNIKKSVENESAGKIILNYSRLNLIEAAKNRKTYEKNKK